MPEENEYFVEVGEEDLEGSDSDSTELYEILAEITGPEEEIEKGLEPEMQDSFFAGFLVLKFALVWGMVVRGFCMSRSLLGSYIHQESI